MQDSVFSQQDYINDLEKKYPHRMIRLSKWTVHEQHVGRGRPKSKENLKPTVAVLKNVLVVGHDRIKIMQNKAFLNRAYKERYGKDKYQSKLEQNTLKIIKIEFVKTLSLSQAPEYMSKDELQQLERRKEKE
jgi:hypothetical protein|tara:strand:+ start:1103 stop:1498 length:396 start_codon:yes stop_codon:yes gene_type:complete